jgi:glycosyltransferase involved in cell wall biosynthesis
MIRGTPILVVSPSAKAGGAERALAGLVRHLPDVGFRPVVALLERGPAEAWLEAAACETAVAGDDPTVHVPQIRELAERIGAAVVLSNKREGHEVGGAAAAELGIPAVWWQQDVPPGVPRDFETAALPVRAVVCSSDHVVSAQRGLTPELPISKIHLGIPVDEVARRRGSGTTVRKLLSTDRAPLVGIVGRLDRWKGQDVFLHAASLVAERRPDARFAVVGGALIGYEGSYPAELARLAGNLGLSDRVHFAGHQDDPYPWLDALDVAVLASEGEPFGLVVVEAMALGTPVVATTPGGPEEIVEHERSGLLVPARAPDELASAVLRILDDPDLAGRLADGGRMRAPQFDERRMAGAFGALLRDVVDGRLEPA